MAAIDDITNLYVGYFNRAPDPSGLNFWVAQYTALGQTPAALIGIAQSFSQVPEATNLYGFLAAPLVGNPASFLASVYLNLFGRAIDAAGATYWAGQLAVPGAAVGRIIQNIISGAVGDDALVVTNKSSVAKAFSAKLVDTNAAFSLTLAQSALTGVTKDAATATAKIAANDAAIVAGGTTGSVTLPFTTGADNLLGTGGNDTFNATEATGAAATWTVGDSVNGGLGTDTFNVTQTAAITNPLSTTVTGIETANFVSGTSGTSINATGFTGLTALNVTAPGAVTVTGAATNAISVTDATLAASAITVNGGSTVSVTSTSTSTGTITIGGTIAAAGAVTVNATVAAADTTVQGAIVVTGGSSISVTTKAANAVATTNTQAAVTATGNASTTAITVNQDKAATASATVVGKVNGAVTIADANAASATAAGTLATVTLGSYGASTINSGALTTINLSGTGGTLGVTSGALTTPLVNTLALNVNGLAGAAITLDADYSTLNIASSTAASTIANVTGTGVTTINVTGDAKATLTDNTFAALSSVVVTNTGGAAFGTTALGTGVTFTGGAGADSVLLGATTKAITMGAGNDTVTSAGAVGAGGSVAAGDGTDTIVMTDAQAAGVDGSAVFNSKFTGFETLQISDAFVEDALDVEGINGVSTVILAAGVSGTAAINNIASGGTVQLNADGAAVPALTVGVRSALVGSTDVLNLSLFKTGGVLAAGSVTSANVETINIAAADASAVTGGSAAVIHTLTLAATGATTVNVTGNNGLTLTNTGNTAITTFNASGVVANGTAGLDTAANLGVTFTSANVTTTAVVTITGGAGNDTLTGVAAKDTINGGAGADLVNGGTSQDTITVGSGRDIVQIANNDDNTAGDIIGSGTAGADIINGFTLVGSAVTAVDFSSNALFQASAAGGANLSLLNIDLTADDAGAGAGANQAIAVEANGTGAGQAVGVTYTVTTGLLTLSGAGASAVDTLAEWLAEAAAVAATAGEALAFVFGSDSYVFAQNGTADMVVQLVGVAGASLVEVSAATTAAAGAILYADIT